VEQEVVLNKLCVLLLPFNVLSSKATDRNAVLWSVVTCCYISHILCARCGIFISGSKLKSTDIARFLQAWVKMRFFGARDGGEREAQPENFLTEIFLSGSMTFCKILRSLLKALLFRKHYIVSRIFCSSH
jgi:hypothetical protein